MQTETIVLFRGNLDWIIGKELRRFCY